MMKRNSIALVLWGLLAVLVVTWLGLIWHTQERLQRHLQLETELLLGLTSSSYFVQNQRQHLTNDDDDTSPSSELRFLIFQGDLPGQGIGNIMNGLLATHLLGDEFERIVCVSPAFADFDVAFDAIHPLAIKYCPTILEKGYYLDPVTHQLVQLKKKGRKRSYRYPPRRQLIEFVNFRKPPIDECQLKAKLASNETVWYIRTNMYPRWPTSTSTSNPLQIPPNYFEQYYQPNTQLRALLPHSDDTYPSTVIHLRKEDGPNDYRKGLDNTTLHALKEYVQKQKQHEKEEDDIPFLVSNHVEFYAFFPTWSHPPWYQVVHSALLNKPAIQKQLLQAKDKQQQNQNNHNTRAIVSDIAHPHHATNKKRQRRIALAAAARSTTSTTTSEQNTTTTTTLTPEQDYRLEQKLQLWADWYYILQAQTVYHTHSDFSASAIHWKDPYSQSSRIIQGYNTTTNSIQLGKEWWRLSQSQDDNSVVLPLVQRAPKDLLHCS